MGGGRRGWAAALLLAAGAAGCDEGGAPVRGFHSRQLVSIRDPTLGLMSFASKVVTMETDSGPSSLSSIDRNIARYATGPSPTRTYWEVNLTDGTVTALGDQIPPVEPSGPAERFDCRYEGVGTTNVSTLFVVDAETREDVASIDRVVGHSGCPRYPDRYLAIVRLDENDVGRLWTGPFDGLVRAEVDLSIDRHLRSNWSYEPDPTKWRMTVLAAAGPAPTGRGIYEIALVPLTIGEVIPPVLADVTWATGAVPSGAVRSDGLALTDVEVVYGAGDLDAYLYKRHMNDGSEVMFTGPWSSAAVRELALFPMAGETARVFLAGGPGVPVQGDVVTWQRVDESDSDADLLLSWDTTNQRLISCPFARGTLPLGFAPDTTRLMGIASPDRSRYAFADGEAIKSSEDTPPGPLIELSTAGAGSCALLAATDVMTVVLANEAVAWIESPQAGGNETLWLAGAPGDAPRVVGSMASLEDPYFIAPHTLQVQLGTDLAWLDVRDDPVNLHYVAEGVFGRGRGHVATRGPRWLVLGYERSSQDATGTLGVVDWQNGDKYPISPSVVDFIVSSSRSAERPLNIVYLVRGRSASPQDGIWTATIDVGDLPE